MRRGLRNKWVFDQSPDSDPLVTMTVDGKVIDASAANKRAKKTPDGLDIKTLERLGIKFKVR